MAIAVGGGVGVALSGGDEEGTTAATTPREAESDPAPEGPADDEDGDRGDPTGSVTTTTAPPSPSRPPSPASPRQRSGYLYSNLARVRSGPNLYEPEIHTFTRDGGALTILGRPEHGWYLVRMDGVEGWVFGTFVRPPSPGYTIIEATSGEIVLRNGAGAALGIENESGPKALAIDARGALWQVVLPDGSHAFVRQSEVAVVESG